MYAAGLHHLLAHCASLLSFPPFQSLLLAKEFGCCGPSTTPHPAVAVLHGMQHHQIDQDKVQVGKHSAGRCPDAGATDATS
eukprot:2508121-Rhodomonas_salina.2